MTEATPQSQGPPMTLLAHQSAAQRTEILCLFCRVLYDTKAQEKGMPHYVPQPYRNRELTSTMAIEKIRHISPAAHFVIMRDVDFFTVDCLGVRVDLYEIPARASNGENPQAVVRTARSS